jgi:hypothetical protein
MSLMSYYALQGQPVVIILIAKMAGDQAYRDVDPAAIG